MTDDLDLPIWGAQAIGEVVNLPASKTYWALEQGYLPGRKVGKKWVSTKRQLRVAVTGREPEAA
jgi:hypothetical protein